MKHNDIEHETWLDLAEAAKYLDVHFTTLRRWADSGAVPCLRTPGGRRRFFVKALDRFIQQRSSGDEQAPLALVPASGGELGQSPGQAIGKAIDPIDHARQTIRGMSASHNSWMERLTSDQRELMRGTGRRLTALLLQYNSRGDGGEAFLDEGKRIIREYARICSTAGFSLDETVRIFLFFSRSIVDAIYETAHIGGSDDYEGKRLFSRTMDFMDGLLLDLISSYHSTSLQPEVDPQV
ncbi:MAG: helix-turn-helix domain-containing protein [Chloroflexi bacterium]|nr:helix-turn-helix domain-containing protein [Chloroflexota bacterium]